MTTLDEVTQIKSVRNHNPDPLLTYAEVAIYLGLKNARSLSCAFCRGQFAFLKENLIFVGSRPKLRKSTLDAYLESRTVSALVQKRA